MHLFSLRHASHNPPRIKLAFPSPRRDEACSTNNFHSRGAQRLNPPQATGWNSHRKDEDARASRCGFRSLKGKTEGDTVQIWEADQDQSTHTVTMGVSFTTQRWHSRRPAFLQPLHGVALCSFLLPFRFSLRLWISAEMCYFSKHPKLSDFFLPRRIQPCTKSLGFHQREEVAAPGGGPDVPHSCSHHLHLSRAQQDLEPIFGSIHLFFSLETISRGFLLHLRTLSALQMLEVTWKHDGQHPLGGPAVASGDCKERYMIIHKPPSHFSPITTRSRMCRWSNGREEC